MFTWRWNWYLSSLLAWRDWRWCDEQFPEDAITRKYTLPKFNGLPLKSYRDPIGSRIIEPNHHFSGALLDFRGGSMEVTELNDLTLWLLLGCLASYISLPKIEKNEMQAVARSSQKVTTMKTTPLNMWCFNFMKVKDFWATKKNHHVSRPTSGDLSKKSQKQKKHPVQSLSIRENSLT